ncbi:hypothetical protein JYG34_23690 [Pseudomonas entomophila]|uniref:Tc toxin subunit A-related protein n=1 Tax=Pseudomonas entomophila TaxID=312306 RepID=UPI001BCE346E|nr:neuraminidase-like domain-containing protein [Pseudomonas entomophila]QVM90970.1 hypothetical protein JYG34_23690 [Pseudomonas entomophila]
MSESTPVTAATNTPVPISEAAPQRATYAGLHPEQVADRCQPDALECIYALTAYQVALYTQVHAIEECGNAESIISLAKRRPDIDELLLDQNCFDSKYPTLKLVIDALSRQAKTHAGNTPLPTALSTAVRRANLPYHQPFEQIQAVLQHKKLSHFDLLQQTEYTHPNFCYGNLRTDGLRAVMRNACGLSPTLQALLLDNTAPTSKGYFKSRFGVEGRAADAVEALCDVDLFCRSTGLTPEDVLDMLALSAVPDDGTQGFTTVRRSTAFRPSGTADTGAHLYGAVFINQGQAPALNLEDKKSGPGIQLKFQNATADHFQKIYKLIHLRAALGLSFAETDLLLTSALRAQNANNLSKILPGTLCALGVFTLLRERYGISVEQYAALLREVSPYAVGTDTPFLDRILDGPGSGQLASVGEGLIIDDREFTLPADADIKDRRPTSLLMSKLSLALGVDERLTHEYLKRVIKQQTLTAPRLSLGLITSLYRLSRLPRLLGLSQSDGTALFELLESSGANIYAQLAGTPFISDEAEQADLLDVLVGISNTERWLHQNGLSAGLVHQLVTPLAKADSALLKVSTSIREAAAQALPDLQKGLLPEPRLDTETDIYLKTPWKELFTDLIDHQGLLKPPPQSAKEDLPRFLQDKLKDHFKEGADASKIAAKLATVFETARAAQEGVVKQILTTALGQREKRLSSDHALSLLQVAGKTSFDVLTDLLAAQANDSMLTDDSAPRFSTLSPTLWHHLQRYAMATLAMKVSPAGLEALAKHPEWFDLQSEADAPSSDTTTGTPLNLDLLYQLSRYRDWVDLCRSNGAEESDALAYLQRRAQDDSADEVEQASQELGRLIGWDANEVYHASPTVERAVVTETTVPATNSLGAFLQSLNVHERNSYNQGAASQWGALGKLLDDYYKGVPDPEPAPNAINTKFRALMERFGRTLAIPMAEKVKLDTSDSWAQMLGELETPPIALSVDEAPKGTIDGFLDTLTLKEYKYYLDKGLSHIFKCYYFLRKGRRYVSLAASVYNKLVAFIHENPGPLRMSDKFESVATPRDYWIDKIAEYNATDERENPTFIEFELYSLDNEPNTVVKPVYIPLPPADISDIEYVLRLQALSKASGLSCQSLLNLSCLDKDSALDEFDTAASLLLGACSEKQRSALEQALQPQLRDALLAYLMSEWVASDKALQAFIPTPEALSNYFLTDVQVPSEVQTTPANHAIASLQHYLHRLTAQLEPGYAANAVSDDIKQAWHQYLSEYRNWRIRQERLIHPENLIHHSNRKHKTTAFADLEVELNQGKLDTSLLQTAICNYLNKFERLSNLQVISGYLDGDDPLNDTYYLIGKTNSTPVEYYWRSLDIGMRDNKKRLSPLAWSEWQKITLASTGEIMKLSRTSDVDNPKKADNEKLKADLKNNLAKKQSFTSTRRGDGSELHYYSYDSETGTTHASHCDNTKKTIRHEEFQAELQFINSINVANKVKATVNLDLVRPVVIAGRLYVFWAERDMQGIPDKDDKSKISQHKAIRVQCCHLQSDGAWSTANEVIRLDGTYGHERGVARDNSLFTEKWQFTLIVAVNDKEERANDPWVTVLLAPIERTVENRDTGYFLEVFDLLFDRKPITDDSMADQLAGTLHAIYGNEQHIQAPYGQKMLTDAKTHSTTYKVDNLSDLFKNTFNSIANTIKFKLSINKSPNTSRYTLSIFASQFPALIVEASKRSTAGLSSFMEYITKDKHSATSSTSFKVDINDKGEIHADLSLPDPPSTIEEITLTLYSDANKIKLISFSTKLGNLLINTLNRAENHVKLHQQNQAHYLELSKTPNTDKALASPYIRLNTLFGKGLVSRATESVERVLAWETQQFPEPVIDGKQPVSALDFHGANGLYFRELFLHLPAMVASRLTEQHQFEEAEHWYLHYLFDPYRASDDNQQLDRPDRERRVAFWNTRPLAEGGTLSSNLLKPVDPVSRAFVLSRYYRQAIFLALLENWLLQGDQAFRQLSDSSLTKAELCYLQALELLGPLPERAAVSRWQPKQLKDIDANCFLSPINPRVLKLRDDLRRRLYNKRHGLTLNGNPRPDDKWERELNDPLVSGKGGLSQVARPYRSSHSPIPAYRFRQLLAMARSAVQQLLDYGRHYMKLMEDEFNTSLSVLLKEQEIKLCDFTLSIQKENVDGIKVKKHTLEINKQAAVDRRNYFAGLIDESRNGWEIAAATLHAAQTYLTGYKLPLNMMKAALAPIPDTFGFAVGGYKLWVIPEAAADSVETTATILGLTADQLLRESEYNRRDQQWQFELKQAEWDIKALESEIKNTSIELNAATLSLNMIKQDRMNLEEAYVAMTTGFTIIPIYNWLVKRQEQLYDAAHDAVMSLCLSAEAAWRYQIGDYKRPAFIRPSGWSDAYKGMLAGESLLNDLLQMENAYLQANERRLTIKKTFSLATLLGNDAIKTWVDALSASTAKETNKKLEFSFAAEHFDQSYPGHYRRQIQHVSVSLQTVGLPEDCEISAVLSQVASTTLVEADKAGIEYFYANPKAAKEPVLPETVKRNLRANQQIALSSARLEDGLGFQPGEWIYELIEHDGRYLPFEGTGAISKWRLEILDDTFAAALKGKLKDIRVTLVYTACDGGEAFRDTVRTARSNWLKKKSEPSDTGDKSEP